MASLPPAIGKYQVIDRLGEGGMGTLYLARDPGLDRLVAIKVLRGDFDDPELRERFSREARTVSNLIHDNIVIIYEYGDFEGQPFIAMQYVAGESLAEIIRRRAYLTLERKLQMIDELCAGMAFAHRAKIVHRDLKPANIMVDADRGQIKILDFGIARNVEANATLYTQVIGTPSYMSPEQAGGQRVDYRSDIFAIGVVAYELLSYRKAFDGDSVIAIQHKILSADPAPLPQVCPGIDPGIVGIVQKALAKDPAARYQDLKAMRVDLARAIERASRSNEGSTIVVSPPAPSHAASTPSPSPSPRLEERRARQIQLHLNAVSAALREENYDAAIESCEHILLLDAHHETALALLEKARAGADRIIVERHLTQARAHLRSGALTDADQELLAAAKIAGTDPAVRALQRELQQARRELERAMERAAASEAALTRARASLNDGAYESALRAASEALAHTPDSTEARRLKAQAGEAIEARARERELERLAAKAAGDARARFDEGDHAAAIGALESFSPAHPLIAAALDELRGKRAAIEEQRRREEERRRIEEERRRAEEERRLAEEARRRERLERASARLVAGRDRLTAGDYDSALKAIADAEDLEPALPGLAALRNEVLDRKAAAQAAAERQRKIDAHLTEAERLLVGGELDAALREAGAALSVDPADARTSQIAGRIRGAIEQRRREAEEREAQAREALRLKQEAEAAEARQRKIAAHVTEAERLLASAELDAALIEANAALAIDAVHARASELASRVRRAIDERRREADAHEARAREALRLKQEEDERRRKEEERRKSEERERELRQAQAARDAAEAAAREAARVKQEVSDRVAAGERLLKSLALQQALEQADAALALAPADRDVQRLRSTIQRAIEDRAKAEAAKRQAALDAERRAKEEAERQRQEALRREALEKERVERAARLAELLATAGRQLESRDFDAALRTVSDAERLDSKSADVKALRSRVTAERAAAEAAAEALAKRQRQVAAKTASAERLLRENRLEKALTDVEAALALDADDVNAKELRVRIQRAIDDRRRQEEEAARHHAEIETTLVSTRTFDEQVPLEATQRRHDQPTQIITARPPVEPVVVKRPVRSFLFAAGIGILALIVGTIAIWKSRTPPPPPPVETRIPPVPPGRGTPPERTPADPLASHLQRLATLDPQRQAESVLLIVVDALRIKGDDERFLGRLNDMFNDAQTGAEREKKSADDANAKTLARESYTRAETARQAGRRRGSPEQTATAIRRSWEARDLFARAADDARGAEKAAAEKAAAERIAAERAAAEKAAAEKAAAQRAAAERAAAERAAAEKAAAERAAAEKAAAIKVAAEKAAADQAAEAIRLAAAAKQRDEQNVRNVVEQYRSAFNNLDAAALSRVASGAAAQVDFTKYRSYTMTIRDISVQIDGDSALVRCTRQDEARVTRGSERVRTPAQTFTMRMRRAGSSWVIESVN